jgi:iron complex outermembrane receptor protein
MHLESSVQLLTGELDNGNDLPLIPANSVRSTLHLDFKNGKILQNPSTFVTLQNVFDQNRVTAYETRTGGYSLLNLGGSTTIKIRRMEFGITVAASNILNKTYVAHLSRLKVDGIPNIGRNVSISIFAGI